LSNTHTFIIMRFCLSTNTRSGLGFGFEFCFQLLFLVKASQAFVDVISPGITNRNRNRHTIKSGCSVSLQAMKRPLLDQIATTLFNLENERVKESSELDEKGRFGEPIEWSEENSLANRLSEIMATGPGYVFKQFVADIVAGDNFDTEETMKYIDDFVEKSSETVVMFSFSTCPFCRKAKDYLDEQGISYSAVELDALDGNRGNEIRSMLGRKTGRTSVPAIWINKEFVGGCNDGPGLLTLASNGKLDNMLKTSA